MKRPETVPCHACDQFVTLREDIVLFMAATQIELLSDVPDFVSKVMTEMDQAAAGVQGNRSLDAEPSWDDLRLIGAATMRVALKYLEGA